jgi:hypothetical protein
MSACEQQNCQDNKRANKLLQATASKPSKLQISSPAQKRADYEKHVQGNL